MKKQTILFTSTQISLFDDVAETVEVVEQQPDPTPAAVEDDATIEANRRDDICKEWRSCQYGPACMDDKGVNIECACFRDEPHRLPSRAFSRDELKILAAGFALVKYSREEKMVWVSEFDLGNMYQLWTVAGTFPTYAAAERKLKEYKDRSYIETSLDGKISMSNWFKNGLRESGFEFYRVYGLHDYDQGGFSIRNGSKNWSICQRAESKEALQLAWDELMQTEKALEG